MAAELTNALRDVQHGVPLGDDRQTLGPYLTNWLIVVKPSVGSKTYYSSARRYTHLPPVHEIPALERLAKAGAHRGSG